MTKEEIINWLIQNDSLIKDIINKTNSRLKMRSIEFNDELKEQEYNEHMKQIVDEITKSFAISPEILEENVDKSGMMAYINHIRNK